MFSFGNDYRRNRAKGAASEFITCGTASTLPKGTEHEISTELCTKFISEADVDV